MRKQIFLTLAGGLLAFIAGIATAESWHVPAGATVAVNSRKESATQQQPVATSTPPATPPAAESDSEIVFGEGRLKIVSSEVKLQNERLRYKVDVLYPQITGSDASYIKKLNQQIEDFATGRYRWLLTASKADLAYYKQHHPEGYNSVNMDYEIKLANDSVLSIYFISYNYGIGAAHSVHVSHVINYDLIRRRELRLTDIFKSRTKYLQFIATYCTDELTKDGPLFDERLPEKAATFENWNMTTKGISFTFDACRYLACAGGTRQVEIPLPALLPWVKPTAPFVQYRYRF